MVKVTFQSSAHYQDEILQTTQNPSDIPTQVTTPRGYTYRLIKDAVAWNPFELIGRRFLGGLFAVLSFSLLYFLTSTVKNLFEKTKELKIQAVLTHIRPNNSPQAVLEFPISDTISSRMYQYTTLEKNKTNDLLIETLSNQLHEKKLKLSEVIQLANREVEKHFGPISGENEVRLLLQLTQALLKTSSQIYTEDEIRQLIQLNKIVNQANLT
ncbi:MAG: hypothetical protein BGO14_05460 [Chlamydiales bacterium 38-26]|nr:hypothetical protein [Chlamydiales bacterium]OJV07921.1 MAG: hypothetical protein BGO14_05460 [Chlamydiales bacterium 38-26]